MANDLTGQNIQDTYKKVLTVGEGGLMYDGTGSLYTPLSASHEITSEVSSSYAETASMASSNFTVQGSMTADGKIIGGGLDISNEGTTTFNEGDITNVGQISADIVAADFRIIQIGANTVVENNIYLKGPVTSSNNISSSGTITATNGFGTIDGGSF